MLPIQAISGILFATLIFTFEMGNYDEYRKQYVRPDGSPSPFESIVGSIWWTIVTMTYESAHFRRMLVSDKRAYVGADIVCLSRFCCAAPSDTEISTR